MFVLYKWWTKPAIARDLVRRFLRRLFRLDRRLRTSASIVAKPDNVPITIMVISVMICIWVGVPPGGAERHARRGRAAAAGRGQGRQGPGLAGPGLHGTDLPGPRDGGADGLGDHLQGAARAARQPRLRAEPRQGAVVLPRPAGNARLLRPVDGGRGLSRPDHRRPDARCRSSTPTPRATATTPSASGRSRIVTWLFGFLILWVVLIFFGTFLRGPNWSFFGPYEFWDPHKQEALNNIDVSNMFWNMHAAPRPADGGRQSRSPAMPHLARARVAGLRAGRRLFTCCLPVVLALHGLPPDVREHGRDPLRASWSSCCCSWR